MKYREENLIDCLRQSTREVDMYKLRNQELVDEMRVKEGRVEELKEEVLQSQRILMQSQDEMTSTLQVWNSCHKDEQVLNHPRCRSCC